MEKHPSVNNVFPPFEHVTIYETILARGSGLHINFEILLGYIGLSHSTSQVERDRL
jgi:hypothetical protein